MNAVKELPADYQPHKVLALSNKRTALRLNLAAIPLLFIFGWLFKLLINAGRSIHPLAADAWGILGFFSNLRIMLLLLAIILMLILHELIHGLFFWIYTKDMPRFALKSGYAFAAAPDWYLPRMQYVWVGLSPLIIISIVAVFLGWFAPLSLVPFLLLVAAFNAAGALGDLIVVGWVLRQPNHILVKDDGDEFRSFIQSKNV